MAKESEIVKSMNDAIDKGRTELGVYTSRELAEHVVEALSEHDPRLMRDWLDLQSVSLLHSWINAQDRGERTHQRTVSSRSVFAKAAAELEGGDSAPITSWLSVRYVVESGDRMCLADMTKGDLVYVAGRYRDRAENSLMQAAFIEALAKKIKGDKTVADVYTEEDIARMWYSLSGSSA